MYQPSALIVDDEPSIRDRLLEALPKRGHKATATGSAREGHQLIDRQPFAAVLVDIVMPGWVDWTFSPRSSAVTPLATW